VVSVDLDDTSRCPVGRSCEGCGEQRPDSLGVAVAETQLGVHCLTVCHRCWGDDRRLPRLGVVQVFDLIARHCEHLGIDLDQMAALLQAEHNDNDKD
jgi:hypothetical protein